MPSLPAESTPATQLTSVVLMGVETTTHWVSGGVPRRLVRALSQQGSDVTVELPTDPNVIPLGHYMLFAMVDDIPSVAVIVRVHPRAGDADADGNVGFGDILAILAAWGPCPDPPAACPADVNNDGEVSFADILDVLANWD